tara:strand:- start:13146 stop:13340 length:195 start_codon:yes stop_codon:yes gene_type:complete
MLVNKITTGYVIQTFDTEAGWYIGQSFVAGEVNYEDSNGTPVDQTEVMPTPEPYLPFNMEQPDD